MMAGRDGVPGDPQRPEVIHSSITFQRLHHSVPLFAVAALGRSCDH